MTIAGDYLKLLEEIETVGEAFFRPQARPPVTQQRYQAVHARTGHPVDPRQGPQMYHMPGVHPPGEVLMHQGVHTTASISGHLPSAPTSHQIQQSTTGAPEAHRLKVPFQRTPSFNDFQNMPHGGPSAEPEVVAPWEDPRPGMRPTPHGPVGSTLFPPGEPQGPRPTYDFSRDPSLLSKFGRATGRVAGATATAPFRGAGVAGKWAWRSYKAGAARRKADKELRKETKTVVRGRFGPPPTRIIRDIANLKKRYPDIANVIDQEAKEQERKVQDYDYSHREAFRMRKKSIERKYKEIGKKMARKQGRGEAWAILRGTPFAMRQAYVEVRDRTKREAQARRDQEHQARVADIQTHKLDVDKFRDEYVHQINHDIEAGAIGSQQRESLVKDFYEGKARGFRERMRNKGKVRARHLTALKRGTFKKSMVVKKRGEKTFSSHVLQPKSSLSVHKSRERSALRKKMESVARTTGQVIASPVTLSYKGARGVARFTGLNELPDVARRVHHDAKHHFVHGFLLR